MYYIQGKNKLINFSRYVLECKYSNKFLNKEDGDLKELEPFNKQDYINIINYETNNFSSREKDHWQDDDEMIEFKEVNEPQDYFLENIIKKELEKNNNNLSWVVGLDHFNKPQYRGSDGTLNESIFEDLSLPQWLTKRNPSTSYKTSTTMKVNKSKKPTPFKIWVEEYNNNERKKYVTYIDINKETIPCMRSEELKTTLPYEKQANIFYFKPPNHKINAEDNTKKMIMAKRNFFLPAFKWKSKSEKIDQQKYMKSMKKHQEHSCITTEHYCTTSHKTKTTRVKSIMEKLNEINLDDKCTPKKTTKCIVTKPPTTKQYSEIFCIPEKETPCPTTKRRCRNYTAIIQCPNCKKKIKSIIEVIKNMDIEPTIHPTECTC